VSEITLVASNQHNYFENATACTLKTTVATQFNVPTKMKSVAGYNILKCAHILTILAKQQLFVTNYKKVTI